jgi:hypothetical protein
MAIDTPPANAVVIQPFPLAGWALDLAAAGGTGVDTVHVFAFPNPGSGAAPIFLGAATYGIARPDIGGIFGPQFTNSGYSLTVSTLPPGIYQIVVFARSTVTGTFNNSRAVVVTVNVSAQMNIDAPGPGAAVGQPFPFGGWAVDRAATSGTGVDTVHVYAFPNPGSGTPGIFLGAATYGIPRSDIGALFGAPFTNSGFALTITGLAPGVYQLVAFARSTVTGTFNNSRAVVVTVNPSAFMNIDAPGSGPPLLQPFPLGGWAVDLAAASGTGVDAIHVYAFPSGGGAPIFLGEATYGVARPDIGGLFGAQFTNSGFGFTVTGLAPGVYQIVVFARSTVTGTFNNSDAIVLTVN